MSVHRASARHGDALADRAVLRLLASADAASMADWTGLAHTLADLSVVLQALPSRDARSIALRSSRRTTSHTGRPGALASGTRIADRQVVDGAVAAVASSTSDKDRTKDKVS